MSRMKSLLTACFTPGEHTRLGSCFSKHNDIEFKVQLEAQYVDFGPSNDLLANDVPARSSSAVCSSSNKVNSADTSCHSSVSTISQTFPEELKPLKSDRVPVTTYRWRSHLSRCKSISASANCAVSAQSLAAGMEGKSVKASLHSDDKTVVAANNMALGGFPVGALSPFHTAAAVPFSPRDQQEDIEIGVNDKFTASNGGAGAGGFNLSSEASPATPLEFCASVSSSIPHLSGACTSATAGAFSVHTTSSKLSHHRPLHAQRRSLPLRVTHPCYSPQFRQRRNPHVLRQHTADDTSYPPPLVLGSGTISGVTPPYLTDAIPLQLCFPLLGRGGGGRGDGKESGIPYLSHCDSTGVDAAAVETRCKLTVGSSACTATTPMTACCVNTVRHSADNALLGMAATCKLPSVSVGDQQGMAHDSALLLMSRVGTAATEFSQPSPLLPLQPSSVRGFPFKLQLSREDTPQSLFESGSIGFSPRFATAGATYSVGSDAAAAAAVDAAAADVLNATAAGPRSSCNPVDKFLRFTDLEKVWAELRDLSFIGSGASGNVYGGTWCGLPVAVKFMISGDVDQLQRQQREAALSRLASHPHLVQTYAVAAAQLTLAHFQQPTGCPHTSSGLSNADLLSTCTTSATTAELYGTYGTYGVSPTLSERSTNASKLKTPLPMFGTGGGGGGVDAGQVVSASHSCGGGGGSSRPVAALTAAATKMASRNTERQLPRGDHRSAPGSAISQNATVTGSAGGSQVTGKQRSVEQQPVRTRLLHGISGISAVQGLSNSSLHATICSDARMALQVSQVTSPLTHMAGGDSSGIGDGDSRPQRAEENSPRPRQAPGGLLQGIPGASTRCPPTEASGAAATMVSQDSSCEIEVSAAFQQVDAKADSFVMSSAEASPGLMLFQPADVLTHIGARSGQCLTAVIMEEMDRGSMHRCIHSGLFHPTSSSLSRRHRIRGIVRTLVEVAQGMAHLHSSELVHGDLKPANVLLKTNSRDVRGFIAKVSDFGVTRAVDGCCSGEASVSTSEWGTVIYTAPEVFNGKAGMPSDVFSFGALTWQLTTGQLPHEDMNPFAVMLAVSRGELGLEWPPTVPRPLRKLGILCMLHDPAARPTFPEIVRALLRYEDRLRQCSAAFGGGTSNVTSVASSVLVSQPATQSGSGRCGGGGGSSAANAATATTATAAAVVHLGPTI